MDENEWNESYPDADMEYEKGLKKGILIGGITALLGVVMTIVLMGLWKETDKDSVLDRKTIQKIELLEEMVDEYYLEEKDPDKLKEGMYAGFLYGLGDTYSRYYTAEEYEEETTSTEGSYVGIGVSMQENPEGGARLVECYEGGPGKEAGLKSGDIITEVDGIDVMDMALADIVGMIKGSTKESVVLTIARTGEDDVLVIEVPIKDVELPSVSGEMLDEKTGYIKITEFKGVTYEQYLEKYEELTDAGMTRLVIDLRDNPGGLLNSVCDILKTILPEGLIVYTEDKNGMREEYNCDGENEIDIPLAVLINGNSASASEIFAGAVQDYGIGTIVGETSFGKGIVQSIVTLKDGSAVKLTVSKYYTPKGNNIHEIGIKPDVEVKMDHALLLKEDYTHEEDNQLQEAIKTFN